MTSPAQRGWPPPLVLPLSDALLVAHAALDERPATVLTSAGTVVSSPASGGWTGVGPSDEAVHHGISGTGTAVAAAGGDAALLAALRCLTGERGAAVEGGSLLVADAAEWRAEPAGWAEVQDAARTEALGLAFALLSRHGDGRCRHADPPTASGFVGRTGPDAAAWVCGGPPCCGVFFRVAPGLPVDAGRFARSAALALLLARAVDSGVDPAIGALLDDARHEALHEGEEAERQAAIMARDGDDSGAMVRRVVGQDHALRIGVAAQEQAAAVLGLDALANL